MKMSIEELLKMSEDYKPAKYYGWVWDLIPVVFACVVCVYMVWVIL